MPSVLGLFGHSPTSLGGCEIYRVSQPFAYLDKDPDWTADWAPGPYVAQIMIEHGQDLTTLAQKYDLFVLPRYFTPNEQVDRGFQRFARAVRMAGHKLVYETDDDYTNEHREVHGGGSSALMIAAMCDAITVSTPHLKRVMEERVPGVPVHVLPNQVDIDVWGAVAKSEPARDMVIGLTGSRTHYYDWHVLADVIPGILEDYPNVTFFLMAFFPDYFEKIQGDRIIREPPKQYDQYAWTIRGIDIVLAPVDPNDRFNDSKSGIKAIEGMASARPIGKKMGGACVVATSNSVYRRVINHRNNGWLVKEHTPEAWDEALRTLLDDHSLRAKLQINGLKWAKNNRSIAQNYVLWRDVYQKILGG